jgi:hypothetical protein
VNNVGNPGAGSHGPFTIATYNPDGTVIDRDTAVGNAIIAGTTRHYISFRIFSLIGFFNTLYFNSFVFLYQDISPFQFFQSLDFVISLCLDFSIS